jgi:hypothetical protein
MKEEGGVLMDKQPNGITEAVQTTPHKCDGWLSEPLGIFGKRVCVLCYPNFRESGLVS